MEIGPPPSSWQAVPGAILANSVAVGSNGGGAGGFPVEEAASERSPRAVHLGLSTAEATGTAQVPPGGSRDGWEPDGEAPSAPAASSL